MSYYTKITKAGLAAITAAMNNNSKVPITYMAFGDGNGYIPEPDENAASLVNEVYRVGVNKVEVHSKNPNWLVCEAIIPSAVGGFNIREVALYDSTGNTMLAIASYPPTYKPTVEEGAAKIQTIRIVIQVDNSGNFELIVDPDVVLATLEIVDNKFGQTIKTVNTKNELKTLGNNNLNYVYVREVDSTYKFDPNNQTPIKIGNWCLVFNKEISLKQLDVNYDDNITTILQYCYENNIYIEIPENYFVISSVFKQEMTFGLGSVKYIFDYLNQNNTEHVAPKTLAPYHQKKFQYGWFDAVQARGNFEHGAGYGLIVNDDSRPQVCGFRTKQQQKNYPSVDMVGLYTHVASPRSVSLSNCTFTSNTVSSADLTSDMDIRVGDFIRTAIDPVINMPWRSEITSIDFETKTLGVTWWLHEIGNGEGTPPNGLTCEAPYTNGLWGHNTNVFLYNGRSAQTIIGYELGVYSEKTRDRFTSIDGYLVVNLTSQVARAQHAFKISGTWDKGLGAYNCIDGVYTDGTTKTGLNFTPKSDDAESSAVIVDTSTSSNGYALKCRAGNDVLHSISSRGVSSHTKLKYDIISFSRSINGLVPSLLVGNLASAPHTTTINMARIYPGHVFEFKQYQELDWTINDGIRNYVLNKAGTIDYLKLYYDGSGWIALFAGKSLI